MLLIFLCSLQACLAQIQLPCDESCAVEKELDLAADSGDFQFEACTGHLVKFQLRPETNIEVDLTLDDADTNQQIYGTNGLKKSEDVVIFSLKNNARLKYFFPIPTLSTPSVDFKPLVPTTTTTTTTPGPSTQSPDIVCNDIVCDANAEAGNKPFPGEDSCCVDQGMYCNCFGSNFGGMMEKCEAGSGYCELTGECVEMSVCAADDTCCPATYSYEQSTVDVCNDFCVEQADGDYPFPGADSCCGDQGTYCNCMFGFGINLSCDSGFGYCEASGECVEMSECVGDTCCPQKQAHDQMDRDITVRAMSIRYSCQANREAEESFEYGSDEVTELLEQNTVLSYNLASEHLHKVDVNLSLTTPIAGFSAVSIGNGMFAFGYGNLNLSILNTESNNTEVQVVTLNSPMDGDKMILNYDLGEHSTTTSTTARAPTTTTATADKTATVYVLAVNENDFYNQYFKEDESDFKTRTWKIITDACSDLPASKNLIHYNTAYSCRKSCYMTDDPDRGCAMMGMHLEDIPESTHCPSIVGVTRIEYFRDQLRGQSKEMRYAYSASRVDVDSCTAINWTTEWLWVAIGLVVGVAFLAVAIMFIKKQGGKMRKSDMDDTAPIMGMEQEKQIPTSRSTRNFDIINENDEY